MGAPNRRARRERGGRGLSVTVLATPVFGATLTREHVARIEGVAPGVRCLRVSPEGHVHADPDRSPEEAEVLLQGSIPGSVFDHLLSRAPALRWVHSTAAGIDHLLTPLARSRGLIVTNARGVFSRPIAEYVVMMVLAISRRLPQLLELQRERTWQPLQATELADVTVGIVGYGSIGQEIARLLEPFGTAIIATRQHPERPPAPAANVRLLGSDGLGELLAQSDVVVLAAPLTPATDGLIGSRALQQMKTTAYLVNIGRGRLVDEVALQRALEAGWIGGAVLDVFRVEPLPPESPLYRTPNLIITPHTSWSSRRVVDRSVDLFTANLARYLEGKPLENVVDLEAGY